MNYFVDISVGPTISGIEEAEFKRLQLFQQAKIPATIVYLGYQSRLHEYTKKFGIQGHSFSMYDYFQGSRQYAELKHFDWRHYWENDCHYHLENVPGTFDIRIMDENELFIMYAHFLDAAYSRIDYVNYFNPNRAKIRRDVYDVRGFLSRTSLLAEQDTINTELYFDQHQRVRIMKQYKRVDNKSLLRKITLKNYHQRDYFFDTEGEFRTFFLNELYRSGDVYYCDRNSAMAKTFHELRPEIATCAVFHSTHVRVGQDILTGTLKANIYDYTLAHPEKLSRIVVSTEQQRRDLLARYTTLPPVVTIPVGFAMPQPVDFTARNPHRIISVARYSPEKQLLHQVKAVERLVAEFPDVELHLLGSGAKIEKVLRDYIRTHHLTEHVFLRGFQTDLTADYQRGALALMTSKEEGFSLATLEALSFSVPVIAYDINYGPSEMITDGENGFLVPADNQEVLYQKIRTYLGNRDLQLKMMANCQRLLAPYAPSVVQRKWQDFVQHVTQD
ncbi:glycosyltransferase [Levilactobacillus enshiensis]|uniref:glycosyltransferase n=1 Tax=Levilactobacillus enshiensis TaxID=2590213 RepID=UPI00117B363D|nr:glycosyltransferase [Levilactobacillus enshiensis]